MAASRYCSEHVHDVVIVPRQDGYTRPGLPVPNPDGLIVRSRNDPRVFAVKEDCADVVEVYHVSSVHATTMIKEVRYTHGQST